MDKAEIGLVQSAWEAGVQDNPEKEDPTERALPGS